MFACIAASVSVCVPSVLAIYVHFYASLERRAGPKRRSPCSIFLSLLDLSQVVSQLMLALGCNLLDIISYSFYFGHNVSSFLRPKPSSLFRFRSQSESRSRCPWLLPRNGDTRFSAAVASPSGDFLVSRLDCLCCRVSVIIARLANSQTSNSSRKPH